MTIADSAACFAIFTKTGPEIPLTTTDMNIRFLAPCLSDVTAKAKVIKFRPPDLCDFAMIQVHKPYAGLYQERLSLWR